MSHNILNEIQSNVLANITHLRFLDFSFNQLRNLTRNTFAGLHDLVELRLNDNQIMEISSIDEFRALKSLKALNVSNNLLGNLRESEIVDKVFEKRKKKYVFRYGSINSSPTFKINYLLYLIDFLIYISIIFSLSLM